MIEFAHALYRGWSEGKSLSEIRSNSQEYFELASRLLQHDIEELRSHVVREPWFIHVDSD